MPGQQRDHPKNRMLGLRTEGLEPGKYWRAKKVEKNSHSSGVAKDNPTKPGCSRKILGARNILLGFASSTLADPQSVSWCQPNTALMCGAMESMHHSCYKEYSGHLIDLRENINTMDLRRTNQVPVVRIG